MLTTDHSPLPYWKVCRLAVTHKMRKLWQFALKSCRRHASSATMLKRLSVWVFGCVWVCVCVCVVTTVRGGEKKSGRRAKLSIKTSSNAGALAKKTSDGLFFVQKSKVLISSVRLFSLWRRLLAQTAVRCAPINAAVTGEWREGGGGGGIFSPYKKMADVGNSPTHGPCKILNIWPAKSSHVCGQLSEWFKDSVTKKRILNSCKMLKATGLSALDKKVNIVLRVQENLAKFEQRQGVENNQ